MRRIETMSSVAATALLSCVAGCAASRNIAAETTALEAPKNEQLRWAFDDKPAGAQATGFEVAETNGRGTPGRWTVERDGAAPSKPNIWKLKSQNRGGTFNLCVAPPPACADCDLSVRIRPDFGNEDQGGGLMWRYLDSGNYYTARWNPLESNYALYKVVGGKRTLLTEVSIEGRAGDWKTIRIVHLAERIDCYIDGRRVIAVHDDALTGVGRVGLWTKADACSSFDDFTLVRGN